MDLLRLKSKRGQPAPWLYLVGVIVWTWTFLGIAAATGQRLLAFPTVIFYVLGGLGPVAVASLLVAGGRWDAALDRSAFEFLRRTFDPRTLAWRWYLWILGLGLVLAVVPLLLDPAVLQEHGLLERGPGLFLLVGILAGALEEPGWRGYAQESLQRRLPVVVASLVIGVFWAAWHLPLFFISGTYQAGLGVGTPAFWVFNLVVLVECPIYAWLYNKAGRVPLAAVLFHALGNVLGELMPDASHLANVGVTAALALILTFAAWSLMGRRRAAHGAGPVDPA